MTGYRHFLLFAKAVSVCFSISLGVMLVIGPVSFVIPLSIADDLPPGVLSPGDYPIGTELKGVCKVTQHEAIITRFQSCREGKWNPPGESENSAGPALSESPCTWKVTSPGIWRVYVTHYPDKKITYYGPYRIGLGACGCSDMDDIKQRMEEVAVAVQSFENQKRINIVGNAYMSAKDVGYSPDRRHQVESKVQEALNRNLGSKNRKALGAKGNTDSACNVKIDAKTPCMRESVGRHEEVHRQACLKTGGVSSYARSAFTGEDRFERDNYTMQEFIDEEIKAYKEESSFLQDQLGALQKYCPDCE